MPRRSVCFAFLVAMFCVRTANAQDHEGLYLTAGFGLPSQQGQSSTGTLPIAPAGTVFGGTIGGGIFVSGFASAGVELSRTRLIENQQQIRDFIMSERRRDNVITTLLRFHLSAGHRVQIEPVVGFAIVAPQSSYQVTGADGRVQPTVERRMPVLVGLAMGVDTRLGGERFSVVPSLRLRVTSGNPAEFDPSGYPRWTVTPGVSARLGFNALSRSRQRRKPTYLIGSLGFSIHPEGVGSTQPPEGQSPGGRTPALMGGGGIFLKRTVAFDVGVFRNGSLDRRYGLRYGRMANDELRKNFITAGVRFRLALTRAVQVEPVTAFLITVHEQVWQQECCYRIPDEPVTVSRRLRQAFPLSPGVAGGVDVPIGNERVAFVPSFRVFFTHRNFENYSFKYVRLTWTPSFGMRLGF